MLNFLPVNCRTPPHGPFLSMIGTDTHDYEYEPESYGACRVWKARGNCVSYGVMLIQRTFGSRRGRLTPRVSVHPALVDSLPAQTPQLPLYWSRSRRHREDQYQAGRQFWAITSQFHDRIDDQIQRLSMCYAGSRSDAFRPIMTSLKVLGTIVSIPTDVNQILLEQR